MKTLVGLVLFIGLFGATSAFAGAKCREAKRSGTQAEFCNACHMLPVTKRECLQKAGFTRARICFDSIRTILSVRGPAVYRACYRTSNASLITKCRPHRYHLKRYERCLGLR